MGFRRTARVRIGARVSNPMFCIENQHAETRFAQARFGGSSVSVGTMARDRKTVSESSAFWPRFRLFLLLLIRRSQVRALVGEPYFSWTYR